jgi:hypothetical protein
LYGQDAGALTGAAGFEVSTISFRGAAGSLILYGAYNLSPRFALGLRIGGGSDIKQMASIEGAAFFRWYFFTQGTPAPFHRRAFFVQAAAGGGIYSAFIDTGAPASVHPVALGEGAAGLRLYFRHNNAPVFLEPFIRYAYPSGLGAGFVFGGG